MASEARPAPLEPDLFERAFDRTSGSPLIRGNAVRVLLDARENYPAWLDAIRSAERSVIIENYIIEEDEVGVTFADALAERARAGVRVRVVRDWLGSVGRASRGFWRRLREEGVEVRVFNPPNLAGPFGWVSRDHRKVVSVDGRVAFVSGLCLSRRWLGDPARGIPPWRDTGVEVRGPAVPFIERAFADVWRACGGEPGPDPTLTPGCTYEAGDVSVRVVAGQPASADLFRLDQILAAAARETLWLTDAYFIGFVPVVQALRRAARDGVDVRLLVPSTTDIAIVGRLSRAGYRPLLEAGVRIFEWNGSMMHAKSAVVDGRFARVGSSNLNLASFIGNYEMDIAIEDERIAGALDDVFLSDLSNSTEITLQRRRRVRSVARRERVPGAAQRPHVGAARFAHAVGVVASGTRALGAAESGIAYALAAWAFVTAIVGFLWPGALAYPIALLATWLGGVLALRGRRFARGGRAVLDPCRDRRVAPEAARPR